MPERPDAAELLAVAREALVALIPSADASHHYTLRMVASAMAIATREITAKQVGAQRPSPVSGDPATTDADNALRQRVEHCALDDRDTQRALHAELVAVTRAKLAVSNPRVSFD